MNFPYPVELEKIYAAWDPDAGTNVYGDQDKYRKLFSKAVELAKVKLQQQPDLRTTLSFIGGLRSVMAEQMGSDSMEKFGILRVSQQGEPCTLTRLMPARFRDTNQAIRKLFYSSIQTLNERNVDHLTWRLGSSRYIVEVIDASKMQRWMQEVQKVLQTDEEKIAANAKIDLINTFVDFHNYLTQFKLPDLQLLPFPDIGPLKFVVGSIQAKMGSEWKLLTRHVTWIKQAEPGPIQEVALEHFKKYGWVTLLHTPSYDLDRQVKALEPLWQVVRNGKDKKELKTLNYYLFHLMIFLRGTASAIEILNEALEIDSVKPNDLEALQEPYLEKYL